MSDLNCGSGGGADTYHGLRIASVFIILVGSTFGALFPVLARRTSWLHVPKAVFEYAYDLTIYPDVNASSSFAKYFGSGVIVSFVSKVIRDLPNNLSTQDRNGLHSLAQPWTD
jgi:solute carrier family 39 (zinc transporter), member 1/2/3